MAVSGPAEREDPPAGVQPRSGGDEATPRTKTPDRARPGGPNKAKKPEAEKAAGAAGEAPVHRATRAVYWALAWVFVGCIGYQVFLAGMAVFVDALNWARHVTFVHYFELIPILMVTVALVGRMPRGDGVYLRPALLFFLTGLQYYFAGSGRTPLAALHPVNALVIFWLAMTHATGTRPFWRGMERSRST